MRYVVIFEHENNAKERNFVIARWLGSKWFLAVLCGIFGYAIESARSEPSFGVSLSFWVLPLLFAATFLGFLPALIATVISTLLLMLTTQQFFTPFDGLFSFAMVVFVAAYLRTNNSVRVVDGVCLYWFVAAPVFIFYHRALWSIDRNGALLLFARELASHLLPALLIQLTTLRPSFSKRWIPRGSVRSAVDNGFTLVELVRIILIPAVLLPLIFAIQVFATESIFVRQQGLLREAEQLSVAHIERVELALADIEIKALTAPINDAIAYRMWAQALLRETPWVCEIEHADLNPGEIHGAEGCLYLGETETTSALVSIRVDGWILWIDLSRLAENTKASVDKNFLSYQVMLWTDSAELDASGQMIVTPRTERGLSTVESLFRRDSVRIDRIKRASLNQPTYIRVTTRLSKATDLGLSLSIWSLLASFLFIVLFFALYRRWLYRVGNGVAGFIRQVSLWQVGESAPALASIPAGLIKDLDSLSTSFDKLASNVTSAYQKLSTLSTERRLSLRQRSAVYRSIQTPIFVFDGEINLLLDQSNVAAESLLDALIPSFDEARSALVATRHDTKNLQTAGPSASSGFTLAEALSYAAAAGRSFADIELGLTLGDAGIEKQYLCRVDTIIGDMENQYALQGLVLVLVDVTEIAHARQQLMHANKMVSIGEVASGAAHELNQPLNIIRMATHNLLRGLTKGEVPSEQVKVKLDRINTQVDRAARLITGMKAFSRTSHEALVLINPSDAISVALELLAKRINTENIELSYKALETPCQLETDVSALQQIVIALVDNAIDVFSARMVSDRHLTITESLSDGAFTLTVADNAGGIADDILDRVFEPFFTTRQRVGNSGLGLSNIYGLIEELNGNVSAANNAQGAVLTVHLPLQSDQSVLVDTD